MPFDAPAVSRRSQMQRGVVIIPACNEAAVIKRTLQSLSHAAVERHFDVIVVCNGCDDNTPELARSVPGIRVLEVEHGSKTLALNVGDAATSLWPRLYLDADIQISPSAVLSVFDRLTRGDVLVARPDSTHNFDGASRLVRSYYRTRNSITRDTPVMWGAGAYALNERGHQRLGTFPPVTSDDLLVDRLFDDHEKAVVESYPAIVTVPRNLKHLAAILRRSHRGEVELSQMGIAGERGRPSYATALSAFRTIRGPQSAFDVAIYLAMALVRRRRVESGVPWERDESSRI